MKLRPGPGSLGVIGLLLLEGFFALTWESLFQPARLEAPWFLGSNRAIVVTQIALGLLALALALRGTTWRERFGAAGLMAVGVMAAVVALFFLIGPARLMEGPPELWPVSLASAFLLLAPAILAGTLLGGYLRGAKK